MIDFSTGWQLHVEFLGTFAKLRKATTGFIVSVSLSIRMEQLGSHSTDFCEDLYLSIFRKSLDEVEVSLKSDKNDGCLHEDPCTFTKYLAELFLK